MRLKIGVTQVELGEMLKMGRSGGRTIRRWEAGENPVPGPVGLAVEALSSGWRPGDTSPAKARDEAIRELTAFLQVCRDAMERLENIAEDAVLRIKG